MPKTVIFEVSKIGGGGENIVNQTEFDRIPKI